MLCLFESVGGIITFTRVNTDKYETWLLVTQLYGSGLELLYVCLWYFALFALYRQLATANHILPNKKIFIVHVTLLTLYFLTSALFITLEQAKIGQNCSLNCQYIVGSINDIVLMIADLLELLTFFLVIFIVLPVTKDQKQSRVKFQNFLFNGHSSLESLERAVLEANPSMNEQDRVKVVEILLKRKQIIQKTESTQSFVAIMVEDVQAPSEYQFFGSEITFRMNKRPRDDNTVDSVSVISDNNPSTLQPPFV